MTLECRDRVLLSQIPVLDCAVPGACNEDGRILYRREAAGSDRLFVRDKGLGCHIAGAQVEESEGLVGTAAYYFCSILVQCQYHQTILDNQYVVFSYL